MIKRIFDLIMASIVLCFLILPIFGYWVDSKGDFERANVVLV